MRVAIATCLETAPWGGRTHSVAIVVGLLGFLSAAFAGSVKPVDPIDPVPIEPALLFRSVGQADVEPMPQYRSLWSIEVNEAEIRQPAQSIRLNGPGFPEIDVPLLRWSPRAGYIEIYNEEDPNHPIIIPDPTAGPADFSWSWYGQVDHVTVSLTVERGVLAGRIWLRDRRFAVRPSAAGLLLGETKSDYWHMHPDEDQERTQAAAPMPPAAAPTPTAGGWDFTCPGSPPPGQYVIDVLVLYTPQILAAYGSHANVVAVIEAARTDANHALRNSGINSITYSLRSVELLPGTFNYDQNNIEAGLIELSGRQSTDVSPFCLSTPNTYVQNRRNTLWADVVALARRDLSGEGTCGVSFLQRGTTQGCIYEPGPGFSDYAYMIFDPECGADRLNFAHELGHQLGVDHDPRNAFTSGFSSCPWSYGHRLSDSTLGFRTVMAYPIGGDTSIAGPACSSDANCQLIDAFSTPALEWTGPGGIQPVGTVPGAPPIGLGTSRPPGWQQARAVDTLLRIAPITAAFKPRPDTIFHHGFQP